MSLADRGPVAAPVHYGTPGCARAHATACSASMGWRATEDPGSSLRTIPCAPLASRSTSAHHPAAGPVDLVGWIGAYAVWTRPDWARRALRWIRASPAPAPRRLHAMHRLGAAAMLAGFQSLAAEAAYELHGRAASLRSNATPHTAAAYEQHVGDLYGLPLGDDPQWALRVCRLRRGLGAISATAPVHIRFSTLVRVRVSRRDPGQDRATQGAWSVE
jgi:hypothetical protein